MKNYQLQYLLRLFLFSLPLMQNIVLADNLQQEPGTPLMALTILEQRIAYCFYTRTVDMQITAKGPDRFKALGKIRPLQAWQVAMNQGIPDKSTYNLKLVEAMEYFNKQVTHYIEAQKVETLEAQKAVVSLDTASCQLELSQFQKNLDSQQVVPHVPIDGEVIKKTESKIANNTNLYDKAKKADSPFHKGVFKPGWKGDLRWVDSEKKERVVLTSYDEIPPYIESTDIHINIRTYGKNARQHCIGHLIESGQSPDGLSAYFNPSKENKCGNQNWNVSLNAIAHNNIRVEIRNNQTVIATGNLWPHNGLSALVIKNKAVNQTNINTTKKPLPPTQVTLQKANKKIVSVNKVNLKSPCTNCLPSDPYFSVNKSGAPYYLGIFDKPWNGEFHWDWHTTGVPTIKVQGQLKKLSTDKQNALIFELKYESKYSNVCVGKLSEVGRSAEGYIIHLKAQATLNKPCKPKVTQAYILPFKSGNNTTTRMLWMLLFSDKALISSALILSENAGTNINIDVNKAKVAMNSIEQFKNNININRKTQKEDIFKASSEYPKLVQLYSACLSYVKNITGVQVPKSYCQCVSEKVGIGGRVPAKQLAQYAKNFSTLASRLQGPETTENKLYFRIGGTCRSCGYTDSELEPWCSGPDSLLYAVFNYGDMIRLLESNAPKIESSDFYKKVFYREYLSGYSVFCKQTIKDPVPFVYTVTEYSRQSVWDSEQENQVHRSQTLVERKYAAKYKRFYDDINTNSSKPGDINKALKQHVQSISSEGALRQSMRNVQNKIKIERENNAALRQHLQGRCDSESVKKVYTNLLGLVN